MKNKACAVSQTNILSNSQQSVLFMTVKKKITLLLVYYQLSLGLFIKVIRD